MDRSEKRMSLIYFVLLFTGLAFSGLGYRFNITGFIVSGVIWILVTPFAVKSTVPIQIRIWAIIFLFIGGLVGLIAGAVLGDSIKSFVGLLGGAIIGGIGIVVIYQIIFDSILNVGSCVD